MIDRYSLPEMSQVWDLENRFSKMLQVEQALARVQGSLGIIPRASSQAIVTKARISTSRILKKEEETKHEVTAFISEIARSVGKPHGSYVHYGVTSSDILDTALSLQLQEASKVLEPCFKKLKKTCKSLVKKHAKTLCAGRTHGMHAEPTSFGFKLLGHLLEFTRFEASFNQALEQVKKGKLSGAVGVYSSSSLQVEKRVCKELGLEPEPLSTQVLPRDRHARVLFSLGLFGGFLERLSIELRHLQRTELAEVIEDFTKGQQGSSAMPHKKNPISAENLTGIARLLRSYVQPALENQALWHERDISHSSVERVILPNAFILSHYACLRLEKVLRNLKVDSKKMLDNMHVSQGKMFSSQILSLLVAKGCSRSEAYKLTQSISHKLGDGQDFQEALQKNKKIQQFLSNKEIKSVFSGEKLLKFLNSHLLDLMKKL